MKPVLINTIQQYRKKIIFSASYTKVELISGSLSLNDLWDSKNWGTKNGIYFSIILGLGIANMNSVYLWDHSQYNDKIYGYTI